MHATHRVKSSDLSELELLRLIRDYHDLYPAVPTPDVALADRFPAKVVMRKMERFDARGYLEWGVSLRTGYLTEKGLARLAELEAGAK